MRTYVYDTLCARDAHFYKGSSSAVTKQGKARQRSFASQGKARGFKSLKVEFAIIHL